MGAAAIGAGMTFGTAGMVGTAMVCGFGIAGIAGMTGAGSKGCVGLVDAGCGTETWGLARACGVAIVASGMVSVGLTLHSWRCHLV